MGMEIDSGDCGVGLPYSPVLSPRKMLEELSKDVGSMLGEVACNGSLSGAISQQLRQRLWDIMVCLP